VKEIRAIFPPLIDSIAINISTIHAYLKIKYPVIKMFYYFLECTISFLPLVYYILVHYSKIVIIDQLIFTLLFHVLHFVEL
jgi:hypothetical protein